MIGPIGVGLIGIAAASFFSLLRKSFIRYSSGMSSNLSILEGNAFAFVVFIVVISLISSAFITVIADGSWMMFISMVAGMLIFSVVIFMVIKSKSH